ncbi:MAG: citrate lyase holo-[acyl-carrier protein] synthase, partial [Ezakiella sp.]
VLSLVVPGIEKDTKFFREFFESEYEKLRSFLNLEAEEKIFSKFGYYAIFPICKSKKELEELKRKTVEIEKTGLIDIDIYFEGKPISRHDIGSPERRCLICENKRRTVTFQTHTKKVSFWTGRLRL